MQVLILFEGMEQKSQKSFHGLNKYLQLNSAFIAPIMVKDFEKLATTTRKTHLNLSGVGDKFPYRFMFIASSSDCSLLTLNMPFKVILRRSDEVVFSCLNRECWTSQKIDENSFKSTNGFNHNW